MSPVESFDYSSVQSRPKRKLDDYAPNFDADDEGAETSDLVSVRMRRDEPNAVHQSSDLNGTVLEAIASEALTRISRPGLQFFIRMMPEGNTMVIQANSSDTVKSIHERIQAMTGIPLIEQRLIYRGKQLQWEQSLAECSIENDAGLQLVGRMRSTGHPQAWQVIDDMVSVIFRLCKGERIHQPVKVIKSRMSEFFSMTPKDENESSIGHIQIFMSSSAPAALVMLYISPLEGNKDVADNAIRHFLNSSKISLPKNLHSQCAPIVLEFCKLLRKFTPEDTLYLACRSTLGSLLENFGGSLLEKIGILRGLKYGDEIKGLNVIRDIFPFVRELAGRISRDLVSSMEMVLSVGPLVSDVRDFTAFLHPLRKAILGQVGFTVPISMPLPKRAFSDSLHGDEMECLHGIFLDLLVKMDKCLGRVEERLIAKANGEGEINYSGWSQYLTILRELYATSKIFQDAEVQFWKVLRRRKSPLCALILRYARRNDDNRWLLEHKDVTNFESRRYLVMMMFPDVKEDYEELHEMLIDRSHLLAESFEYIARAEPEALRGGLFMEFKNEEATGPGVLREWFFLVCQALFNPQNALFVACPNDCRRFYPNPASKVDPMHLQYFSFSGRVIALALMHRVQVGVVFDRVFYLQLAGKCISLEDIQDADPSLYNSCKQILAMDAEFIDSDGLGLTFVREVEELGSRKIVELCPGGKNMVVNSRNREEYVNLLIRHRFVTSISEQMTYFAHGFSDILSNTRLHKLFFQSLELEDLDRMLFGSERPICVEDWKAHTEYNGFKENDPQILWFWKIVGGMSPDQKKVLLFFWTSVKHLPVEGFRGCVSRLTPPWLSCKNVFASSHKNMWAAALVPGEI
ncbi:E3 ubiquitin-protein ligase UPL5 [Melia azedarach]|uniref:E3 ubiquitin-protein ligase UPL5 n=1 Tax=Melia azedarach TaxID=155640 RepID=A0ACC1WZ53_MELAZ|nr:E3 ubiquitin-protein ligase UPL5 [Melia azedarach]